MNSNATVSLDGFSFVNLIDKYREPLEKYKRMHSLEYGGRTIFPIWELQEVMTYGEKKDTEKEKEPKNTWWASKKEEYPYWQKIKKNLNQTFNPNKVFLYDFLCLALQIHEGKITNSKELKIKEDCLKNKEESFETYTLSKFYGLVQAHEILRDVFEVFNDIYENESNTVFVHNKSDNITSVEKKVSCDNYLKELNMQELLRRENLAIEWLEEAFYDEFGKHINKLQEKDNITKIRPSCVELCMWDHLDSIKLKEFTKEIIDLGFIDNSNYLFFESESLN